MAIVTGDRYLEQLVRFVERNTGPLLEGVLTLKLNPVGLHYVHTRLEALHELEGLLTGAPVDYLRAYVSDLGDHRALEQLRRILGLLTALKVVSVLPRPGRDPTPVSLLPFGRLKVLELRGCDLSTSAAKGLLVLRHTLEKIICYNSTDALRHVFASRIVDIKDSPVWNKLRLVSCACNGLVLMDESLQLLPAVETLDLSRNRFAKVDNLQKLMKLRYLDLGFNHLRSITLLREVSCRIIKLILRNNALTSVRGIENLKSLEGLDLSYNIISSFTDLELIASLPSLQNLWLEGNPISCSRWYRAHVFSFFSNPEKLELDEKGISTREYWERHVIIASNRKKPAGYGFYFPAKDTAENETSQSFKKKKYSRLASIQDEEQRRFISSDQESVSCDSDSLIKEEPISDNETRIAGLMNIAKNMKNEQSVAWLREFEFKDYMDRVPEKFETEMEIPLGHHDTQKGKSQKPSGGSSKYVAEIAENLESFTSSSTSEFDMSFKEAYIGEHHSKGTTRMDTVVEIGGTVSLNEAHSVFYSEQDKLKYHSKEQGVSPLKMKLRTDHSNAPAGDLEAEDGMGVSPLTAIDKIIGSHTSSLYPQSPPHYREDILHRRLDLEEEFLQNSADVNSVVSSDSDTSSSSGASCELSSSILELDGLIFQASIKQGFGDNHRASHNMECIACGKHDKLSTRENNVLHDNSSEKESNTVANLIQYAAKSSYAKGISNNGVNSFEHVADKEVGGFDTQKAKPKLKRRFISLSGVLDVEPVYCKLNGNSRIIRTDLREIHGEHRSASENYDKNHSYVADSNFSGTLVGTRSFGREQDKNIVEFLQLKVADFGGSETVEEVVHCDCIFQIENIPKESEVAIVRSCENNLYVLLVDATPDGKAVVMTEVLGYHNLEDTTNAVVGLGLQVLRISLKGNITYIFLTRSCEKLKNILSLLKLCDSAASNSTCYLKSWEQVQLEMLEKYVFGLLKGIFLYSMVLFWHDNLEGESWFTRSIFVTEGYVVVCNENVPQFGCSIGDSELSYPYYSLDSFCAIEDISEVVVELQGLRCLTLTCVNLISGTNCLVSNINKSQRPVKTSNVRTWKVKWYSDDALFKFVALVKAIYLGLTDLPLPVKCIT